MCIRDRYWGSPERTSLALLAWDLRSPNCLQFWAPPSAKFSVCAHVCQYSQPVQSRASKNVCTPLVPLQFEWFLRKGSWFPELIRSIRLRLHLFLQRPSFDDFPVVIGAMERSRKWSRLSQNVARVKYIVGVTETVWSMQQLFCRSCSKKEYKMDYSRLKMITDDRTERRW